MVIVLLSSGYLREPAIVNHWSITGLTPWQTGQLFLRVLWTEALDPLIYSAFSKRESGSMAQQYQPGQRWISDSEAEL
ncbi:MAG: hypothetical protein L0G17_19815, partial [Pseudomonas sp.]|uniref:hypothetical protein n=1 Tax=Pseudomonas sp. TaxID=306 RepID=UPI00264821A1